MSRRLTRDELVAEAAIDASLLDRAVGIGALAPGEDGRYDPRDAAIVATVSALLDAGIAAEDLRRMLAERGVRFDVIGRLFADPGPVSPRTVGELDTGLDPGGHPVARLYDALALPEPDDDDRLPAGEEEIIEDYLRTWLLVDPSGAAATRVARAIRDAVAHVTETWLDTWDDVARPILVSQGAPRRVGVPIGPEEGDHNPTVRMAEVGRRLLPMLLDRSVQAALNARIVAAVERALVEEGRLPARPQRPAAVAFADLSGYTSLTVEAGDEAAARASERLREVAEREIAAVGGRLVKVLGDGVLLLFPDAASGVTAALAIVAGCRGPDMLPAHVSVAAGRVIRREGDIYGATVNLAARLVGLAGPGEVVVEEGVIVALPRGTARFEPVGRMPLKGFPEPVAVWRAKPPAAP